jgi:hypothetical protein
VIAQTASSVVTVEFVPEFLEKNRELNAGHDNVTYLCEDVLRLSLPPSSFDLVFSCWLQMYLSDDEVSQTYTHRIERRGVFVEEGFDGLFVIPCRNARLLCACSCVVGARAGVA